MRRFDSTGRSSEGAASRRPYESKIRKQILRFAQDDKQAATSQARTVRSLAALRMTAKNYGTDKKMQIIHGGPRPGRGLQDDSEEKGEELLHY